MNADTLSGAVARAIERTIPGLLDKVREEAREEARRVLEEHGVADLRFYSYPEFLDMVSISRSTGDRLRKAGELQVFQIGGRLYVEHRDAVKFMREKSRT